MRRNLALEFLQAGQSAVTNQHSILDNLIILSLTTHKITIRASIMFSIRSFTRSIPRTVSRFSTSSARRPLSTLRQPTLVQSSWTVASRPRCAAFSTSRVAWDQEGQGPLATLWVTYTLLTNRHSRPRAICQTRVRASDGERHERLRRVPREHQGLSR